GLPVALRSEDLLFSGDKPALDEFFYLQICLVSKPCPISKDFSLQSQTESFIKIGLRNSVVRVPLNGNHSSLEQTGWAMGERPGAWGFDLVSGSGGGIIVQLSFLPVRDWIFCFSRHIRKSCSSLGVEKRVHSERFRPMPKKTEGLESVRF